MSLRKERDAPLTKSPAIFRLFFKLVISRDGKGECHLPQRNRTIGRRRSLAHSHTPIWCANYPNTNFA